MGASVLIGALELGLLYAIMGFGVYLSFRVLNIPDLTICGSFTCGCAAAAMCTLAAPPYLGLAAAFICGMCCGLVTGLLMTKLHIQPILSGILTMTAVYSVNLRIQGGLPNVSLFGRETIFTQAQEIFGREAASMIVIVGMLTAVAYVVMWIS